MEQPSDTNGNTTAITRPGGVTGAAWFMIVTAAIGILFLPAHPIDIIISVLWIVSGIGLLNGGNWAKWLFIVVGAISILLAFLVLPMANLSAVANGIDISYEQQETLRRNVTTIVGIKLVIYIGIVSVLNSAQAKEYLKQR